MASNILTATIELCAEDRARIDKVIDLLSRRPNCERCAQSVADTCTKAMQYAAEEHPVADPFPAPAEEQAVPTAAPTAVPTASLAEVRQKVVELSAAGKKAAVRDIVKAYAENVTSIPEDKLGEVLAKLKELG